jgi:hypothetical protein
MSYPLVYMLIFIIPTSIRIYQFSTGKTAPFVVGIFDKVGRNTSFVGGFTDEQFYLVGMYCYPRLCGFDYLR